VIDLKLFTAPVVEGEGLSCPLTLTGRTEYLFYPYRLSGSGGGAFILGSINRQLGVEALSLIS
jgi:hypothetical protein